ncbi:MAG: rod-binding protein [Verrucomicrobiae bacterium]|nr:rod-binding protein [Verrucomicrobiae bacterium]
MSFSALTPLPSPASVPVERLEHHRGLSEGDKVAEACRQFEAILLRQMLTDARKAVIPSDLNRESATSDIYQDMINTQLADAMSQSGGFGLARSLQVQLESGKGTDPAADGLPGAAGIQGAEPHR